MPLPISVELLFYLQFISVLPPWNVKKCPWHWSILMLLCVSWLTLRSIWIMWCQDVFHLLNSLSSPDKTDIFLSAFSFFFLFFTKALFSWNCYIWNANKYMQNSSSRAREWSCFTTTLPIQYRTEDFSHQKKEISRVKDFLISWEKSLCVLCHLVFLNLLLLGPYRSPYKEKHRWFRR